METRRLYLMAAVTEARTGGLTDRVCSSRQEKQMEDQEAYEKARKKVEAKIGFYIHLVVYTGVNILLIIINIITSTQYLWFKWPLIGWGIGLFFHAFGVFAFSKGLSLKERMIEKELKKKTLKKQHLEE
jgi:hypothetical protein